MKGWPLWKEVIKYHWYDVLFDRLYSREYSTLPVNDIWQDIAKRWTFEWGLSFGIGVNIFLFIFVFFRLFHDWWLLVPLFICIGLCYLISSVCSVVYLYIRMRMYYVSLEEAARKADDTDATDEI